MYRDSTFCLELADILNHLIKARGILESLKFSFYVKYYNLTGFDKDFNIDGAKFKAEFATKVKLNVKRCTVFEDYDYIGFCTID